MKDAVINIKATSVTISTLPGSSPFAIGQKVQFTCEVTAIASIESNYVNYNHVRVTGKKFTLLFQEYTMRHTWFYCMASSSGVIIGKATKVIEVHGKKYCFNINTI